MNLIKKLFGAKPSQDEFAGIARKALQKYSSAEDITYDKENFSMSAGRAKDLEKPIYYLGNAYDEYCMAPKSLKEKVLEAYFGSQMLIKIPSTFEEALPNLLVRIQPRAFFTESAFQFEVDSLPHIVIAEHFGKTLVYDAPTSLLQIDEKKLEEWGVKLENILQQATQNLSNITPEPFTEVAPGLYVSQYQDSHDASRILLLDRIKECNVQGRPLVMIPHRDTLIITGESDHANHKLMLNMVEEARKLPRAMPAYPIVLSEQTWHLWHPLPHHEEKERFKYFSALSLLDIYDTQRKLLIKIHEKENKDVFVANYTVFKKDETGEISSMTAWTEGVPTLLPEVDKIGFVRVKGESGELLANVSWKDAIEIVGNLMKPVGIYPERYEVTSFPDESQIAELKRVEVLQLK